MLHLKKDTALEPARAGDFLAYHRRVSVPCGCSQGSGTICVGSIHMRSMLQQKGRHICTPLDLHNRLKHQRVMLFKPAKGGKAGIRMIALTAANWSARRREWSQLFTLAPASTSASHRATAPVAAARCRGRAPKAHGRDTFPPDRISSPNTSILHLHVGSTLPEALCEQCTQEAFLFDTT